MPKILSHKLAMYSGKPRVGKVQRSANRKDSAAIGVLPDVWA